jgi:hypothetical protein
MIITAKILCNDHNYVCIAKLNSNIRHEFLNKRHEPGIQLMNEWFEGFESSIFFRYLKNTFFSIKIIQSFQILAQSYTRLKMNGIKIWINTNLQQFFGGKSNLEKCFWGGLG